MEHERQSPIRFFVQYLLSPMLVVLIGLIFNSHLEERKAEVAQLQIARESLPSLFSDQAHEAFATERLISRVLEDEKLSEEIGTIVKHFYLLKVEEFIDAGDFEAAGRIVEAVKTVGGQRAAEFDSLVTSNQAHKEAINIYEQATHYEEKGFESLISGDYETAIAMFDSAGKVYPTFHQVYEIGELLRKRRTDLPDAREEILREIYYELSWKAPTDLLKRIRKEIGY